jgi:hydroxypyruvate reductase
MDPSAVMKSIAAAALTAVEPFAAVSAALRRDGSLLHCAGRTIDLDQVARVMVVGAGKAGAPMAQAVEAILGDRIKAGLVVVKHGHGAPTGRVRLREAGHPVPTQEGLDAGAEILALADAAGPDDLVICLLSGGGSALLEALPQGITLADLQQTTDLLLASGAPIGQMNTVRKQLSRVKGGRLAHAVAPARLLTLVLSDVVGSPLDIIASGPTVPNPADESDAWAIVQQLGLSARLPAAVSAHLRAAAAGATPPAPRAGDAAFTRAALAVVADNAVAAQAAAARAAALGYTSQLLTTFLEGEAREVARVVVALAREVRHAGRPVAPPACLVLGGETTVTLHDGHGRGGRNQELALAAALALEGMAGVTLMALATDGTDGPTDAAGAMVDGGTAARARALGLDPASALRSHNAYPLLKATGALLVTGPTRTNVNDLIVLLIE